MSPRIKPIERPNVVLGYPAEGPNPKQKIFHRLSNYRYRGFGGARGGGKTCAGVQEAIKLSALYPGNVGIVGRYYLRDVVDNIVPELMKWIPPELRTVNQADNKITFWNGSIIYYRALEDPDRLLGAELGWAFIDQAEQVGLESIMNLDGCIRLPDSSRISNIRSIGQEPELVGFTPGIPYSMFMSANPAPGWFKEWFIDNASPIELEDKDIRGNKIVILENGDKVFIPSLPRDNPYLPKDYEENLRRQHPEAWSRRYLDGDWDVYEGQFFCFSPDTEILTGSGWKPISEVSTEDRVATLSPADEMSFLPVSKTFEYDYSGDLCTYQGRVMDFAVTPNHKMWCRPAGSKEYRFVETQNLQDVTYHKRAADYWKGKVQPTTTIDLGLKHAKTKSYTFDTGDWCELLGWYLSEGSIEYTSKQIKSSYPIRGFSIAQSFYPHKVVRIKTLLDRMNIKYSFDGKRFRVSSSTLGTYFLRFGRFNHKFIPRSLLNLDKIYLRRLLDGLLLGDGCPVGESDANVYATTSSQLADDIQELCIRLGLVANMHLPRKGRNPNHHTAYIMTIFQSDHTESIVRRNQIDKVPYQGKVYCVSVEPYHTIMVRRNGKAFWTGNSEWDDHVHWVYMDPFNLPGNLEIPHYRSIDHGTTHPTCALYAAYDKPYIYVYDEYYIEGAPVYQNVEMIKAKYPDRVFWGTWIDHRTNAKDQSGRNGLHSIRSQYVDGGILCELAYQDVPGGLNRLRELLRVDPDLINPFTGKMGSPRLFIANRCTNLRRSIMAAQYDTRSWYRAEHKEDRIRRVDIDPVDALRYLTTGILMTPIKRYEAGWSIS